MNSPMLGVATTPVAPCSKHQSISARRASWFREKSSWKGVTNRAITPRKRFGIPAPLLLNSTREPLRHRFGIQGTRRKATIQVTLDVFHSLAEKELVGLVGHISHVR